MEARRAEETPQQAGRAEETQEEAATGNRLRVGAHPRFLSARFQI